MIQVVILICSIYVPPEQCNKKHALDVSYGVVPVGVMETPIGQIALADTARGPDWLNYEKIEQVKK